ncbi:hypothetical protein ACA910_022191 [Epithemia clementina (nom. ined.)]
MQSCYEVRQISRTKGRGLVAVRDIVAGEQILLSAGAGVELSVNSSCSSTTTSNINAAASITTSSSLAAAAGAHPMVPPVLLESRRSTHCAVCFRRSSSYQGSTTMAPSSSVPNYVMQICSKKCRETAQKVGLLDEHKLICIALQQGRIPKLFPTALLVYRLLVNSRKSTATGAIETSSNGQGLRRDSDQNLVSLPSWEQILDMAPQQPNDSQQLSSDNDDDGALMHEKAVVFTVLVLEQLGQALSLLTSKCSPFSLSAEKIQHVLARVKANAFSITDTTKMTGNRRNNNIHNGHDDGILGTALFEAPAYLVNHSCEPNALQTFELGKLGQFPRLQLIAAFGSASSSNCTIIQANQEITISYMMDEYDDKNALGMSSRQSHLTRNGNISSVCSNQRQEQQLQRREALRKSYHFHCQCPQCSTCS